MVGMRIIGAEAFFLANIFLACFIFSLESSFWDSPVRQHVLSWFTKGKKDILTLIVQLP